LWIVFFLVAVACAGSPSGHINGLAVSPDGKLIFVTYEAGGTAFIYKIPVETGNATRLTNATTGKESSPAFSPDGKRVAYTYWPSNETHPRIVIVNVDGSNPRQWSPSGVADFSPVLSPDNKTIVFSRSEFYGNYSPIAQPHPHEWSFYASDLDGSNIRALTSERFYMVSPASISPDGKSMVVVTEGLETSQHIAIYSIIDPGQTARTFQPHVPNEDDHKNPSLDYPHYMPDGSILFMAASNGRRGYDYDIYELNVQSGALERLTQGNGYATDLAVSADGKTAAFLKWRKNWFEDLTGSNQVYLLEVQSHKLSPLKISGLN
jgi:Tol biopolymer transport system component